MSKRGAPPTWKWLRCWAIVCLLLVSVAGACSRPTQWDFGYSQSLAKEAERHRNQSCKSDRECAPFLCESGVERCRITSCETHADCYPNSCVQGLCVQAPLQAGSSCEPLDLDKVEQMRFDDAADAYESMSGCACSPSGDFAKHWASGAPCGSFPCTPAGCYVAKCSADDDCHFGLCSHHASGPSGYCVTSDPY